MGNIDIWGPPLRALPTHQSRDDFITTWREHRQSACLQDGGQARYVKELYDYSIFGGKILA